MWKATARASADVALIKYWGKKDQVLRLPENGSISLILNGLDTVTTIEFTEAANSSAVHIDGKHAGEEEKRVLNHVQKVLSIAVEQQLLTQEQADTLSVRVDSQNTFPPSTGLSSSGSGFAALTLAAVQALGIHLTEKELSILARQGSGTACRCMSEGIVEWLDGETSDTSYSVSLHPAEYWDLRDVIAVVDAGKKRISSTEGHQSAHSSVFYQTRLQQMKQKIVDLKAALDEKNFTQLGELIEAEALEFHSILLTSHPALITWYPGTVEVMLAVQQLRAAGVPAYFTINTGFNVHVITLPEFEKTVQQRLEMLSLVQHTLLAKIGQAPRVSTEHLF